MHRILAASASAVTSVHNSSVPVQLFTTRGSITRRPLVIMSAAVSTSLHSDNSSNKRQKQSSASSANKLNMSSLSAETAEASVLTWDTTSHTAEYPIHIHLQPVSAVWNDPPNNIINNSNNTVTDKADDDAVLQFERKLRKAQHAKKAGKILDSSDLQVLYHDPHIVVVNKPPGVLCVPGLHSRSSILDLVHAKFGPDSSAIAATTDSTTNASTDSIDQARKKQKQHKEKEEEVMTLPAQMVVHRLDMDTSGIVIFGRTLQATRQLQKQFRDRQVRKEYECLVMGHVPNILVEDSDSGSDVKGTNGSTKDDNRSTWLIDLPLQRDHEHPPFRRVSTPASEAAARKLLAEMHQQGVRKHWKVKNPQSSQSRATILQREQRTLPDTIPSSTATSTATDSSSSDHLSQATSLPCTRIRLEPLTGRTHQLRVHCAAIGYPICGDATYSLYGEAAPVGGLKKVPAVRFPQQTTTPIEGCSIEVQKAWTKLYPPNEKPMCLHAALLELDHPVTGEIMKWEAPPDF